ncbi:RimJ/RimL family protein N-acetyltransferase [Scopulibacillus daqui]|uniref:RimJ/RimL family protein N-acetyltransferase n=1 Tax=Scopulibacillus daqui TaxID=1469162 RepID=A0ABS2Q1P9_9BACL|nr:RimJ/RimL family protein N-acetyltransferase [Scopulibacillus daqui]
MNKNEDNFAPAARAMHVYKKMGFKEEGRQVNQIRFEDGTYVDDILMAIYL